MTFIQSLYPMGSTFDPPAPYGVGTALAGYLPHFYPGYHLPSSAYRGSSTPSNVTMNGNCYISRQDIYPAFGLNQYNLLHGTMTASEIPNFLAAYSGAAPNLGSYNVSAMGPALASALFG